MTTQTYNTEQLMMVFSAIAYEPKDKIAGQVTFKTNNDWRVAWGPEESDDGANLAYVVASTEGSNQYAVVIRGTNPVNPFSWQEDLDAVKMVEWPYKVPNVPVSGTPEISQGLFEGLNNILALKSEGLSLQQYCLSISDPQSFYVTGHSLGGGLTPIVASWLFYWFHDSSSPSRTSSVKPYSFAGQTPGNSYFIEYVNATLPNDIQWRYYNTLDVVPLAYNNLLNTLNLYADFSLECPDDLAKLIIDFYNKVRKNDYMQPNGNGVPLMGTFVQNDSYIKEVGAQHSHCNYLRLLGVSLEGWNNC